MFHMCCLACCVSTRSSDIRRCFHSHCNFRQPLSSSAASYHKSSCPCKTSFVSFRIRSHHASLPTHVTPCVDASTWPNNNLRSHLSSGTPTMWPTFCKIRMSILNCTAYVPPTWLVCPSAPFYLHIFETSARAQRHTALVPVDNCLHFSNMFRLWASCLRSI